MEDSAEREKKSPKFIYLLSVSPLLLWWLLLFQAPFWQRCFSSAHRSTASKEKHLQCQQHKTLLCLLWEKTKGQKRSPLAKTSLTTPCLLLPLAVNPFPTIFIKTIPYLWYWRRPCLVAAFETLPFPQSQTLMGSLRWPC